MTRRAPSMRGFLLTDLMIAIGIVMLVALTLAWTRGQQMRSSRRLAEHRQAVRLAEDALFHLQTDRPPPAAPPDWQVRTERLVQDDQSAGEAHVFVRITIHTPDNTASLVGIVPAAAADAPDRPGGQP